MSWITALGVLSIYFVFMRYSDRVDQRTMLGLSSAIQILGMLLLVVFPLTAPVALGYVILTGAGGGFGQQSFQLWSGELFPTLVRSTAQGFMFAVVRIALGLWSFFVPVLTAGTGFRTVAWILTGFLVVSGLIGVAFAPRNAGKSLEEIQLERHGRTYGVPARAAGGARA